MARQGQWASEGPRGARRPALEWEPESRGPAWAPPESRWPAQQARVALAWWERTWRTETRKRGWEEEGPTGASRSVQVGVAGGRKWLIRAHPRNRVCGAFGTRHTPRCQDALSSRLREGLLTTQMSMLFPRLRAQPSSPPSAHPFLLPERVTPPCPLPGTLNILPPAIPLRLHSSGESMHIL